MRRFVMFVLVGVCWADLARADVPATVGYNGMLFTCQAEDASCEGYSYEGPMTFRLWSDPVSVAPGDLVWEETQPDVKLEGGWYHVDLGTMTPLPADAFSGLRWLEVQVGEDPPLQPRAFVGAVPWALGCVDAQTLGGQGPSAFAPASHGHAWGDITGTPATYPPSAHQHAWTDLTGGPGVRDPGSGIRGPGSRWTWLRRQTPLIATNVALTLTLSSVTEPVLCHCIAWKSVVILQIGRGRREQRSRVQTRAGARVSRGTRKPASRDLQMRQRRDGGGAVLASPGEPSRNHVAILKSFSAAPRVGGARGHGPYSRARPCSSGTPAARALRKCSAPFARSLIE